MDSKAKSKAIAKLNATEDRLWMMLEKEYLPVVESLARGDTPLPADKARFALITRTVASVVRGEILRRQMSRVEPVE